MAKLLDIVRSGVAKGLSNAEPIATNPDFNASSIRAIAARERRKRRLEVDGLILRTGPPALLPGSLMEALSTEAKRRKGVRGANDLLRKLVGRIVKDDLYNAILDEE